MWTSDTQDVCYNPVKGLFDLQRGCDLWVENHRPRACRLVRLARQWAPLTPQGDHRCVPTHPVRRGVGAGDLNSGSHHTTNTHYQVIFLAPRNDLALFLLWWLWSKMVSIVHVKNLRLCPPRVLLTSPPRVFTSDATVVCTHYSTVASKDLRTLMLGGGWRSVHRADRDLEFAPWNHNQLTNQSKIYLAGNFLESTHLT